MDRGVLGALTVVKRVSALCCLVMTGCVLNPQGEDPGFEENASAPSVGLPEVFPSEENGVEHGESDGAGSLGPTTGALPGASSPVFPSPQNPAPGSVVAPTPIPVGTGVPGLPSDPASPVVTPDPTPEPEVLEPSPDFGAGGSSPSGNAGAGGAAVDEPPGIDFDGGTLNYASPTDADDTDGDITLDVDAGAPRPDAGASSDAGDVNP